MIGLARRSNRDRLVCLKQKCKRVRVLVQGVPGTGMLHVGTLSQPVHTSVGGPVKTRVWRFADLKLPHSCREMSARQFCGPRADIPSMFCRQLPGGGCLFWKSWSAPMLRSLGFWTRRSSFCGA